MAIILVKQGYKSTKSRYDYRTRMEITYGGKKTPMEIGKSKDNYDRDIKPRCFNCNVYKHMVKDCQKLKKEKETRKFYKCNKIGHLLKKCRIEQRMKNRSIQEDSDNTDDNN